MRASRVGPVIIKQVDVAMAALPEPLHGFRIAHISDMHFSRWIRVYPAAQRALLSHEYDILCVTGDFGDFRGRWARSLELAERFLRPIVEQKSVYAVLGNHDDPSIAREMSIPVRWLNNEGVTVDHEGASLYLAGVDQNVGSAEDLGAAVSGNVGGLATVLLAHFPSTVFRLTGDLSNRVSLVLSGHTHGGQIRLPGLGCLWPNDKIPREMSRGLHRVNRGWIHVSPGLGTSLPVRIRLFCPPEVTVLRLISVHAKTGLAADKIASNHVSAGVSV